MQKLAPKPLNEEYRTRIIKAIKTLNNSENESTDDIRNAVSYLEEKGHLRKYFPMGQWEQAAVLFIDGGVPKKWMQVAQRRQQEFPTAKSFEKWPEQDYTMYNLMLSTIVWLTDSSLAASQRSAELGLVSFAVDELNALLAIEGWSMRRDIQVEQLTMLLFNIMQHYTPAVPQLREKGGVQLFSSLLQKADKSLLQEISLVLLSYIMTEEESKSLTADRELLARLKMHLDDSLQLGVGAQGGGHMSEATGWNAVELLRAMANLLGISDAMIDAFIDIGLIASLEKLLGDNGTITDEEIAAVKCLWTLSFRPEAAEEIKANTLICHKLKKYCLSSQAALYGPSQSIRRQLLLDAGETNTKLSEDSSKSNEREESSSENLEKKRHAKKKTNRSAPAVSASENASESESDSENKIISSSPSGDKKQVVANASPGHQKLQAKPASDGHVFLSYQSGYRQVVERMRDRFEREGFSTWMDKYSMFGDILEAMAGGIEAASVVIICFSQSYKASPYCRAEATYTFAEKKPFVPVRVERDYRADGWLGLIVNLELYFDASSDALFDASIDKLVQSVHRKRGASAISATTTTLSIERPIENRALKLHSTTSSPPHTSSKTAPDTAKEGTGSRGMDRTDHRLPTRPREFERWNNQDVDKWLVENQLKDIFDKKICKPLNGELLAEMKRMKEDSPAAFSAYLQSELNIPMLAELRLRRALDLL